jgi:hypothetical protein
VNCSVKFLSRKELGYVLPISDIHFEKAKSWVRRQSLQSVFFKSYIVVIIEIVDANYLITTSQQPQSGSHPNKASRTRQ